MREHVQREFLPARAGRVDLQSGFLRHLRIVFPQKLNADVPPIALQHLRPIHQVDQTGGIRHHEEHRSSAGGLHLAERSPKRLPREVLQHSAVPHDVVFSSAGRFGQFQNVPGKEFRAICLIAEAGLECLSRAFQRLVGEIQKIGLVPCLPQQYG